MQEGPRRTTPLQLSAINMTPEAWAARCRLVQPMSMLRLQLGGDFDGKVASCWFGFLERADVHSILSSNTSILAARAEVLIRRPRVSARLVSRGGVHRRARLLVVDPLASRGADQLSAVPTMSARLARAARAMDVELDAVLWRLREAGQSRSVSQLTEAYVSSLYRRAFKLRLGPAQASKIVPSVPVMRINHAVFSRPDSAYDGAISWAEPLVGVADRLTRLLAFQARTWPLLHLAAGEAPRPSDPLRARRLLASTTASVPFATGSNLSRLRPNISSASSAPLSYPYHLRLSHRAADLPPRSFFLQGSTEGYTKASTSRSQASGRIGNQTALLVAAVSLLQSRARAGPSPEVTGRKGGGDGGDGGDSGDSADDDNASKSPDSQQKGGRAAAPVLLLEPFLDGVTVFAELVLTGGVPRAVSLRASKLRTGCEAGTSTDATSDGRRLGSSCRVVWAWPADVSEAYHSRCQQVAREAASALKLKNGVFGMRLKTDTVRGCAFVSLRLQPHPWPLASEENLQLFFARDLWLPEVAALLAAGGGDPTAAMAMGTRAPAQLLANCSESVHSEQQLLFHEWLMWYADRGQCKVTVRPLPW